MATDPRKRQKKLAKKAAQRKEKRHQMVRAQFAGLAERMTTASRYPVIDALVGEELWTEGIGQVILSRELPNGSIAFASFLVDSKCLGVKDVFGRVEGRFSYQEFLANVRSQFDMLPVTPADVRKLVEDAIAFARRAGLAPHPDYAKVHPILGDIDPAGGTLAIEFGKDGKPFFIAGPYDTPARCRAILNTLERHCGPGGYNFVIPMEPDSEFDDALPDEEEPGEWEDDFDEPPDDLKA